MSLAETNNCTVSACSMWRKLPFATTTIWNRFATFRKSPCPVAFQVSRYQCGAIISPLFYSCYSQEWVVASWAALFTNENACSSDFWPLLTSYRCKDNDQWVLQTTMSIKMNGTWISFEYVYFSKSSSVTLPIAARPSIAWTPSHNRLKVILLLRCLLPFANQSHEHPVITPRARGHPPMS